MFPNFGENASKPTIHIYGVAPKISLPVTKNLKSIWTFYHISRTCRYQKCHQDSRDVSIFVYKSAFESC
ncbi:hypothetical protein BVRB_5g110210 isoform A [Beta vulgaris subsp. vulgaris]|uniref:Uncharacterized protein n=1 Tax=Beta vulgaris subsp. vulgaris TaxID=3555 RepID=A0A0J8CCD5_BETVV|nr:hypothetical protein BVRB_5g110210 isoform A [Beta vulgaris subsp. vulgaris]